MPEIKLSCLRAFTDFMVCRYTSPFTVTRHPAASRYHNTQISGLCCIGYLGFSVSVLSLNTALGHFI